MLDQTKKAAPPHLCIVLCNISYATTATIILATFSFYERLCYDVWLMALGL